MNEIESEFSIPFNLFLNLCEKINAPPYTASVCIHNLYLSAIFDTSFKSSTLPVIVVPAVATIQNGKPLLLIFSLIDLSKLDICIIPSLFV